MESLSEENDHIQDALQSLQSFRHKMRHSPPASDRGQDQKVRRELGIFLFGTTL